MTDPEESRFSATEIAETRHLISQTLEARGIRMDEAQIDVAMRRLLMHARISRKPPLEVAREMVGASAEPTPPDDHGSGKKAG